MRDVPHDLSELRTPRLVLRAFRPSDAKDVQRYAGDYDVARMTSTIPFPYEDGMAEAWIATHPTERAEQDTLTWAVERQDEAGIIGAASLTVHTSTESAELGYWIAKPQWGHGFATETAITLVAFGFNELELHRVFARHMTINPASGRVMQKAGMTFEGIRRHDMLRFGEWRDVAFYSILESEYRA
jgi:ribosomal-protein-alanine N-acetyltransferase